MKKMHSLVGKLKLDAEYEKGMNLVLKTINYKDRSSFTDYMEEGENCFLFDVNGFTYVILVYVRIQTNGALGRGTVSLHRREISDGKITKKGSSLWSKDFSGGKWIPTGEEPETEDFLMSITRHKLHETLHSALAEDIEVREKKKNG